MPDGWLYGCIGLGMVCKRNKKKDEDDEYQTQKMHMRKKGSVRKEGTVVN